MKKKILSTVLSMAFLAVSALPAFSVPVAAGTSETLYCNFTEITSSSSLAEGTQYMFIYNKTYTGTESVVSLPTGSARLKIDSSQNVSASGQMSDKAASCTGVTVPDGGKGEGFDTCSGGGVWYGNASGKTSSNAGTVSYTGNAWWYGCNAGGAYYVGPFFCYTYTEKTFTADNITATIKAGVEAPVGEETVLTKGDVLLTLTIDSVEYTVPEYTMVDGTVNPTSDGGDRTVRIQTGSITKDIVVVPTEAVPDPVVDDLNTLSGLEADSEYDITYTDSEGSHTVTVTSSADGTIDISGYSGEIEIVKKGNTTVGSETNPSEPIEVTVPRSGNDIDDNGDATGTLSALKPAADPDNDVPTEINNDVTVVANDSLVNDAIASKAATEKSVKVYLTSEYCDDETAVPQEVKDNVDDAIPDSKSPIVQFFDVNLYKQYYSDLNYTTASGTPIKITETSDDVTITMGVLQLGLVNRLYRYHDDGTGNVTFTEIPATFNRANKTVEFKTDKLSYFVVVSFNAASSSSSSTKYAMTDGSDSTYSNVSGKNISFVSKGDLTKFLGVKVDGVAVDSSDYVLDSSDMKLEFTKEFLNSLKNGSHKVYIEFTDGYSAASFRVENDASFAAGESVQIQEKSISFDMSVGMAVVGIIITMVIGTAVVVKKRAK